MKRHVPRILDITHFVQCCREWLAKNALEGKRDFEAGSRITETMKYANDLVLMVNEETIQDIPDWLEETRNLGMEINVEKPKVMRISGNEKLLRIIVETKNAYCIKEIRSCSAMAKNAFTEKSN